MSVALDARQALRRDPDSPRRHCPAIGGYSPLHADEPGSADGRIFFRIERNNNQRWSALKMDGVVPAWFRTRTLLRGP